MKIHFSFTLRTFQEKWRGNAEVRKTKERDCGANRALPFAACPKGREDSFGKILKGWVNISKIFHLKMCLTVIIDTLILLVSPNCQSSAPRKRLQPQPWVLGASWAFVTCPTALLLYPDGPITHPFPDLHYSNPMLDVRLQKSQGGEHHKTPAGHSSPPFHSSLIQSGLWNSLPGFISTHSFLLALKTSAIPGWAHTSEEADRPLRWDSGQTYLTPRMPHTPCTHEHTCARTHTPTCTPPHFSIHAHTCLRSSRSIIHLHTRKHVLSLWWCDDIMMWW